MKSIEVVAAVIRLGEKYLCVQRGQTKFSYTSFRYEFPGGKVEAGESKEAALKREWQEELDIEIENIQYLASSKDQQDYPFHLTCFTCTSKQTPTHSHAHDQWIWTTPDHIYDYPFFESDKALVQALKEVWDDVSKDQ